MDSAGIIAGVLFLVILFVAIIKSRRANPEQSSTKMHPDNFRKPTIESVQSVAAIINSFNDNRKYR